MKAVRIHQYGGVDQLKLEDGVADPTVTATSVLIESAAASINPIDWKMRSGALQKAFPAQFPLILGRDVSGLVRSVGSEVRHFKPGDRVVALAWATYAELVSVDAADVTHVPDGVALEDAAAIPLVALTGDQLVREATSVQKGQTLLVTGALGGVGRAAVHAATKMGVRVIAGVRAAHLEEARSLKVDGVLALDDEDAIGGLTPVDAVADTVGGATAGKLLAKVRSGGSFGYAAMIPEGAAEQYPAVRIKRIMAHADASKVREFADDLRDGKFTLPIGARFPLGKAGEAHAKAEAGHAGKVLLIVG